MRNNRTAGKILRAAAAVCVSAALLLAGGCISEIVTSMEAEGDASFMFCDSGKLYRWGGGAAFGGADSAGEKFTEVPGVVDLAFGDGFGLWLTREGVAVTGSTEYLPFESDAQTVPATLLCTLNSTGQDSTFGAYELVDIDLSSARQVDAGADFGLILLSDGTLYGFGSDESGALRTDAEVSNGLVEVEIPGEIKQVTAAGGGECAALMADGSVAVWGGVFGAELRIADDAVFTQVESAGEFCAALDDAGNVWHIAPDGAAEKYGGIADAISIAAGDGFALAVTRGGALYSWGANSNMQLGRAAGERDDEPAQVEGLNGVIAVSCGKAHSLALRKDGTLWAWGAGEAGQLGTEISASGEPLKLPELAADIDIR